MNPTRRLTVDIDLGKRILILEEDPVKPKKCVDISPLPITHFDFKMYR